jgi:hypothetical protein
LALRHAVILAESCGADQKRIAVVGAGVQLAASSLRKQHDDQRLKEQDDRNPFDDRFLALRHGGILVAAHRG